ncbi:MAG: DUF1295 domain-containing protein [Planctomycetes bacterium]|nr:DUF1295 domain-containing protein [Planctomycetota bacterium]
MAALWRRQRAGGNAGWVDLAWSAGIGLLAVAHAVLGAGWGPRRLLVAALAGGWSLRLSLHLWERLRRETEDGRYAALRRAWGARFHARLFWFYQVQALLVVLLGLCFQVLCAAPAAGWRATDAAAVLLFALSLAGESVADAQLRRFRRDPAQRGRTCRAGLWGWSRHPNYFFEWLHWLVYPLLGVGLAHGALLWFAPALMLLLVLKVTGVPPTEEQALRSRGDDYRAYQRTTNAFFPGPPRAARAHAPRNP